jgi:putative endonuclease
MDCFFVYILRCSDGSFYVGVTDNIEERFSEHPLGLYDWLYEVTQASTTGLL